LIRDAAVAVCKELNALHTPLVAGALEKARGMKAPKNPKKE
jgi:hypothetical protein